jgi:hypothetical protein
MTKQVQRRRGTATQHTSFTGAEGETSVNTTNKSVHVHDGSTAGGIEAARADLVNVSDASLNAALTGNTVPSLTITSVDINGGTIDGATIDGRDVGADGATLDGIDASVLTAGGTGYSTSYVSTVAVGGTTFAQPAVSGTIHSDQGEYVIEYAGATGITVASGAASVYVYIDNASNLQQQTTIPTRQDWSRKMFTMRIAMDTSAGTILGFEYLANPLGHYPNSIRDFYSFMLAQGVPFKKDQVVTGRSADLGFDISAGEVMEFGGTGDIHNANIISLDAVSNAGFFLTTRTAFDAGGNTDLPKFWDNGSGTPIALGSTTVVGHRLYRFSNGNLCLQYGQGNYANMTLAKAGVLQESYVLNPALKNATFFGWWFIQSTATVTAGTPTLTAFVEYTLGIQGGVSSALSGAALVGNNGSDFLDAAAVRTNIGLGTGDSPTFAGGTLTGDVSFGDNDKAIFGAGSDLRIYHDGNHSVIKEAGTGNLQFYADTRYQFFNADGSSAYAQFIGDGGAGTEYVQLRYGNSPMLETTSTGIDVTGTITSDGLTVGIANVSNEIRFAGAAGSDALVQKNATALRDELQIYSSGDAVSTGSLGSGIHLYGNSDSEHAGQLTILTGSDDNGDARLIVSGSDTTKVTIGNGIFDYVDAGLDHALLNLKGPSGQPALMIEGASGTEGDIVVPDGEAMYFGHWNKGTSTFTDRLQIDSSGNVGIGTNPPSSRLHIEDTGDTTLTVKALSSGSGNDDDANLVIDASGGGEAKINFSLDGAEKASIEWFNGGPDLNIKTASGTNGNIDFQPNESLAMRIDSSGHAIIPAGVTLGTAAGTYVADNTLDDYEEGTWTPVAADATTGGNTTTTGDGRYTKVGRVVVASCELLNVNITGLNSASPLYIQGLPFANNGIVRTTATLQVNKVENGVGLYAHLSDNDSYFQFKYNDNSKDNGAEVLRISDIYDDQSDLFGITLVYHAAS